MIIGFKGWTDIAAPLVWCAVIWNHQDPFIGLSDSVEGA